MSIHLTLPLVQITNVIGERMEIRMTEGATKRSVWLDEIDLSHARHGMGKPVGTGSNAMGGEMRLDGKVYNHGLGVHSSSLILIDIAGQASRFTAVVGKDDEQIGKTASRPVEFVVLVDGEVVWRSGTMQAGDTPKTVDIDITDCMVLGLRLESRGFNSRGTIANWADAAVTVRGDYQPFTFADKAGRQPYGEADITETETAVRIATAPKDPAPSINNPARFGIRPGSPIVFVISVSGERPISLSVEGLPKGISFDTDTGSFRGTFDKEGTHSVTVEARNAYGRATQKLVFEVGEGICLTPPMGWESWNCWGPEIDERKAREAAEQLVSRGLIDYGWRYVIVDDGWQGVRDEKTSTLQPNEKFPDMKALFDFLHERGLKAGIYSTPWACSYMGLAGGSADTPEGRLLANRRDFGVYPFHEQDARQFAEWGADLLKYDWGPVDYAHAKAMSSALRSSGRDIVYSLSGSVSITGAPQWMEVANYWRTTPDITDSWKSIYTRAFNHYRWSPFQRPGNWNDPDMLVLGHVGWGKNMRDSRLLPQEQLTHMSLWSLFASPLLLGCDLSKLDEYTESLLKNPEVVALNQDPLGLPAHPIRRERQGEYVFTRALADGSTVLALVNTEAGEQSIKIDLDELGIRKPVQVRNVWERKDLGVENRSVGGDIAPHGTLLLRLTEQ